MFRDNNGFFHQVIFAYAPQANIQEGSLGLKLAQMEAFWLMINRPEACTPACVHLVFFPSEDDAMYSVVPDGHRNEIDQDEGAFGNGPVHLAGFTPLSQRRVVWPDDATFGHLAPAALLELAASRRADLGEDQVARAAETIVGVPRRATRIRQTATANDDGDDGRSEDTIFMSD